MLLSGVKGLPPPPTTKVGINIIGGYEVDLYTTAVGLDVEEKFRILKAQVEAELTDIPIGQNSPKGLDFLRFELVGRPMENPIDQVAASCLIRITAQSPSPEPLMRVRKHASENFLRGYAGYTGITGSKALPTTYGEYFGALVDYSAIPHRVTLPDGIVLRIPHAPDSAMPPSHDEQNPPQFTTTKNFGETINVPLGYIAHARSGDKGGNSNVGFWTTTEESYEWLRSTLTLSFFQQLLGNEGKGMDLKIERIEFPNVRAVHFLIRGLLGKGCTSNMRLDMLSKSVGEFLRAKKVDVPKGLLKSAGWHPAVKNLGL